MKLGSYTRYLLYTDNKQQGNNIQNITKNVQILRNDHFLVLKALERSAGDALSLWPDAV